MTEESVSYSSDDSPGPAVLRHQDKQSLGDNCSIKALCNTRLSRKAQGLLGQHEGWALLQFTSVTQLCPILCDHMDYRTPGFPVLHYLLEFAQTHVHWISDASNHLIFYHPLLLLPLIFPSIRVFSNESVLCTKWPKYWSFSFSSSPSNEHSGLISFRMDWLDLLAVQQTLKSLLQHHNFKALILWLLAFFIVQLSHLYMTTGKTIASTIWTFVG